MRIVGNQEQGSASVGFYSSRLVTNARRRVRANRLPLSIRHYGHMDHMGMHQGCTSMDRHNCFDHVKAFPGEQIQHAPSVPDARKSDYGASCCRIYANH